MDPFFLLANRAVEMVAYWNGNGPWSGTQVVSGFTDHQRFYRHHYFVLLFCYTGHFLKTSLIILK